MTAAEHCDSGTRPVLKPCPDLLLLLLVFDPVADAFIQPFRHPRTRKRPVVVQRGNGADEFVAAARLAAWHSMAYTGTNAQSDRLPDVGDALGNATRGALAPPWTA